MRGAFLPKTWKGEKVYHHGVSVLSLGSGKSCNVDEMKFCISGTNTKKQDKTIE